MTEENHLLNPVLLLEEASMRAFPALSNKYYDGWVLRFAEGYSGRLNSVYALYESRIDIDTKIRQCEELYRAEKLPVKFKICPAVLPPDLDFRLENLGYVRQKETLLMTYSYPSDYSADVSENAFDDVEMERGYSPEWLSALFRMSDMDKKYRPVYTNILNNIFPVRRYLSITVKNKIIACGLAIADPPYVGLYSIITDPDYRRQGHARRLITAALNWAYTNDANKAYLQVEAHNLPAILLYTGLGFGEAYRYWYRSKE